MMSLSGVRDAALVLSLAVSVAVCQSSFPAEAGVRATEPERVRALVEANMARAGQLHADDGVFCYPFFEGVGETRGEA
jgi:hypothetical protein